MFRLPDTEILALLEQDVPLGDLTTEAMGIGDRPARIVFAARGAMTVCGTEEAERMFGLAGGAATELHAASGTEVAAGALLLSASASGETVHRVWKTAQTLIEYASGIATRARAIVRAAAPIALVCTRKNFPGTKNISVKAVRAGGAWMHRLGLSETLLVFPEHRALSELTPGEWVARLRAELPEKKVVAEADTLDAALELARAGVDVIQLERPTPEMTAAVVAGTRDLAVPPTIAVAGGVNETNAAAHVAAGAGLIVSSAPYFARPADVKVTISAG